VPSLPESESMHGLGSADILLVEGFRLDRRGGGLFWVDQSGLGAPVTLGSRARAGPCGGSTPNIAMTAENHAPGWARSRIQSGDRGLRISPPTRPGSSPTMWVAVPGFPLFRATPPWLPRAVRSSQPGGAYRVRATLVQHIRLITMNVMFGKAVPDPHRTSRSRKGSTAFCTRAWDQ